MTKFHDKIYELRKENGFTQEEIAKRLKVSRQTISNWETGSAQPTIDKAMEIADIYEISMDELMGKRNKMPRKTNSDILLPLLNQVVTLYVSPACEVFLLFNKAKIKNCEILEVNPTSIRVMRKEKKQMIEMLIFLKDIVGFEMEVI